MLDTDGSAKQRVARAYEVPRFNESLDEVLHPGGLKLTSRIAELAKVGANSRLLDIASGRGTSACFLSQTHQCSVVGIDLSVASILLAIRKTAVDGPATSVHFAVADAERLPFVNSAFDVVISECSFSLLPDKRAAAREIARVLPSRGCAIIADIFLEGSLSQELRTSAFFSSCFSGAETLDEYLRIFKEAGFVEPYIEDHSTELIRIAYKLQIEYGSLENFWLQFAESDAAGCDSGARPADLVRRLFAEGKPGYALIALTRV